MKTSNNTTDSGESVSPSTDDEKKFEYVPAPAQELLHEREALLYNRERERFIDWLTSEEACQTEGTLSERSQANFASRLDQIYRWVWHHETDGYVTKLSIEHADAFVRALEEDEFTTRSGNAYSNDSKQKFVNTLKKYFHFRGLDESWEPEAEFSQSEYAQFDPLRRDERQRLREAATAYGSMPNYNDLSPEERSRKKALLAQRLEKPKAEINMADWQEQNRTWKYASLVFTALDAGLRPCEVERACTSWFQPGTSCLHIPKEDAAKNRAEWTVALRDETADALEYWLAERQTAPQYDERDHLWLNREGNPYTSRTLNYLFRNLLEEADIDATNRKLTWYSIRHSLGTYMTQSGDLEQARVQMRHKSAESTQRYVDAPPETRRNTLDRMEN